MFIGDLIYFTSFILDKNHNRNSSTTDCVQLLYVLDSDYYKATGNFLVDDNSFGVWDGLFKLRIPREVRDRYGRHEEVMFDNLNLYFNNNLYFDPQYDKTPNIDFTTYKDASGQKIDIDLFKSIYSPNYLGEKIASLTDERGYWSFPDARTYPAAAKALLNNPSRGNINPISNRDRMLEIEGKLGGKIQEYLDKEEEDRQIRLAEKIRRGQKIDDILGSISNGDSSHARDRIIDNDAKATSFFKRLFSKKKPKDNDLSMEF